MTPQKFKSELDRIASSNQIDIEGIVAMRAMIGSKIESLHEEALFENGKRSPDDYVSLQVVCDNRIELNVTMGHNGCRIYNEVCTIDQEYDDGLSWNILPLTNFEHLIGTKIIQNFLANEKNSNVGNAIGGVLFQFENQTLGCDFFEDIYYRNVKRYNVSLNPDWSVHCLIKVGS